MPRVELLARMELCLVLVVPALQIVEEVANVNPQ